jgi:hypothetical protein
MRVRANSGTNLGSFRMKEHGRLGGTWNDIIVTVLMRLYKCWPLLILLGAVRVWSCGEPPSSGLRVSGEDLAWKVENEHMIVDLGKNPGTGRNGQINTIFVKGPKVLLTRGRATSTLHLSPNAAAGGQWAGINRWDPPSKWAVKSGRSSFRLEREGEMPGVPGVYVKTTYEFFAGAPAIAVEESVEAAREVRLSLLRLDEWSFAPGADDPFSHLGWEESGGRVVVKKREKEETLPLETRWLAFLSESKEFGFASVAEGFSVSDRAVLRNAAARFAGAPHYFYRVLISSENRALVAVPAGTRCAIRYWLYCFKPGKGSTALEPVSRFWRALRHPVGGRIDGP